MTFPNLMGTTL